MSKLSYSQFVPNFLSYVSAKYHLNWLTVGIVITKIKKVNFLLRHNVVMVKTKSSATAEIARVGGRYAVQSHSR